MLIDEKKPAHLGNVFRVQASDVRLDGGNHGRPVVRDCASAANAPAECRGVAHFTPQQRRLVHEFL